MKRRAFLTLLLSAATLAATTGIALAASYTEDVVAQLVKFGFSNITTETTLLGRVKIVAMRADGQREIVINPRTGEILRDVWMPNGSSAAPRAVLNDVDDDGDDDSSGSGGAGSDDDNAGSGGSGRDDDNKNDDNGGKRDDKTDD